VLTYSLQTVHAPVAPAKADHDPSSQYLDITEYLSLPQSVAARKLGLPVSTLSKVCMHIYSFVIVIVIVFVFVFVLYCICICLIICIVFVFVFVFVCV